MMFFLEFHTILSILPLFILKIFAVQLVFWYDSYNFLELITG